MALLGYSIDLEEEFEYLEFNTQYAIQSGELTSPETDEIPGVITTIADPDNIQLSTIGEGAGSSGPPPEIVPEQYIRGTVKDVDGIGVARVVIAIDRGNGQRLAITTSSPSGDFVLRPRTLDPCILVAVPLDGEQLNAVVLDNVRPVPG